MPEPINRQVLASREGVLAKLCWSMFDCMLLGLQSACFPIHQALAP